MQQRTRVLRHRPRTFCDKIGKVKRLSEEKPGFRPVSTRRKDQLADALASMRTGSDELADPAAEQTPAEAADDQTIAPPPQVSSFIRKKPVPAEALDNAIKTRRTLIPVLLTLGLMLPIVGSLKWLSAPESPFAAWPGQAVWLLIVVGKLLLITAFVNMWQVKVMMEQRRRHGV
jgi:hypothetical protein